MFESNDTESASSASTTSAGAPQKKRRMSSECASDQHDLLAGAISETKELRKLLTEALTRVGELEKEVAVLRREGAAVGRKRPV